MNRNLSFHTFDTAALLKGSVRTSPDTSLSAAFFNYFSRAKPFADT